jgi:hypothetical protein
MYCNVSGGRLGNVTNWPEGAAVVTSMVGPVVPTMVGSVGAAMVGQVGAVPGPSIPGIEVAGPTVVNMITDGARVGKRTVTAGSVVGAPSNNVSSILLGPCVASVTEVGGKVGMTLVPAPLLEDEREDGDAVVVVLVEGGPTIEAVSLAGGNDSTEPPLGLNVTDDGGRNVVGVVAVGDKGEEETCVAGENPGPPAGLDVTDAGGRRLEVVGAVTLGDAGDEEPKVPGVDQ